MADLARENSSNGVLHSREYPRTPSSISPVSSRRGSLRPAHPESGSEHPTQTSPSSSLRQKRAVSLGLNAANESRLEDPPLASASSIGAVSAGEKVCLCQPDPKIPRPRNAFILYRQHYQAQVVALHPGLANPEISKIIGEQWTSQPAEVKNEWKRLAEEEKIRHQRQYPDYRYQPRRAGTTSHNRRISSADGSIRCPKCNGRYILTPRAPSTPLTPSLRAQYDQLPPSSTSQRTPSRTMTIDNRTQLQAISSKTPRAASSHSQVRWRPGPLQQNHAAGEMNSPRDRRISIDMSTSPEFKRRRFNSGSQGHPLSSPYDLPQYRSGRPAISATGYPESRRTQLHAGPIVQQQKGGMMEPPPRPSPAMHQFSSMSLNSPYEESLRLPPLQTQGGHFGPGSSRINGYHGADSQARSVEAMVMTIPYINKIRVLSKIAPPLAPPGPTSPVQNVRGAVIAVEGADYKLVAEVGSFIHEYLSKEPKCLVKTWPSSVENADKSSAPNAEMTGMDQPPIDTTTPRSSYLAYLNTIQSWHARSTEIINFITGASSPQPVVASASSPSPATIIPRPTPTVPNLPLPPPSTTATQPKPSAAPPSTSSSTTLPSQASNPPSPNPPLPIALLPTGFSLSLSDAFASAIPITDAYAPVDHWQWMATLWRGIVGPDLTVYVKALDSTAGGAGAGASDREAAAAAAAADEEELARFGGVECRWDVGAVVVRAGGGGGSGMGGEGGEGGGRRVEEKTLRRLGFEVLEWVRGGGGGGASGRVDFGRG